MDNSEELATGLSELIESVTRLRQAVESLVTRAEKSEKRIAGIIAAVAIDLVFTAGFAFLYWQGSTTQEQLNGTRVQVLCPLYSVLLGAYNPSSRAPGLSRQTYENVFAQLRASYAYLECQTPLVPGPIGTTPVPVPPRTPGG